MMQLFIKESNKNNQRMTVRDDRGQILYIIEGHWGRKNDITSIYELNGKLLLSVKQIKNTLFPVFLIFEEGEEIACMRKHPGLFGIRDSYFTISPLNWVVTGDFDNLYFKVNENQQLIMECEKDIYGHYAVYELNVMDEKNAAICALISTIFDHHLRVKDEDETKYEGLNGEYTLGFNNFSLIHQIKHIPIKYTPLNTKTR